METVTILTTEPNEVIDPIHDRMPVVLVENGEEALRTSDEGEALAICGPYEGEDMEAYEMSPAVNSPENDRLYGILPADFEQSGIEKFGT